MNKKNILVIEDNPVQQMILKHFLEKLEYDKTILDNAESALTLISQVKFDFILLDINLTGMSGLHFLNLLRESFSKEQLPVIIISALSQDVNKKMAENLGANFYLQKPISLESLKSAFGKSTSHT